MTEDVQKNNLASTDRSSLIDISEGHLQKTLEDISPDCLQNLSYSKYVAKITKVVKASLQADNTNLLLLVSAIKATRQPCYKRDVMLEVLNIIERDSIGNILLRPFRTSCESDPWKEFANTIVTLPDLVANCNALKKYDNFVSEKFYSSLLKRLYASLVSCHIKSQISRSQKLFYIQLVGRIAFSGHSQLVWDEFTSKLIHENRKDFKLFMVDIFQQPIRLDDQSSEQLELFIEPLYIPIFHNLTPSENSGDLIESLLGDIITSHETLEYIICNKSILQSNFTRTKARQEIILFNIFSYLSQFVAKSNILTKTLKSIVESWSNSTKIFLRTYDQNRYISCAFIIAFRFCLKYDRDRLVEIVKDLQTMLMQVFPVYLNRASSVQRNHAMSIGEIIFPALHELVVGRPSDDNKLSFEVDWDEDCIRIKKLYSSAIETLFPAKSLEENQISDPLESTKLSELSTGNSVSATSIEDDLVPYDIDEDEDDDEGGCDEPALGEDSLSVPIYLRDCINGLSENNKPKYVKLCLIKTGELISQLSAQDADPDKTIVQREQTRLGYSKSKPCNDDAIRDTAIELAQILLYIDNQFDIDSFEEYRLKALSSLCVAVPDLVVKYLLDNFNETNKSIKQQLDILQVLVASAQQLSGCLNDEIKGQKAKDKINKFAKYGALYFYGIAHRLKVDFDGNGTMLPSAIVRAAIKSSSIDDRWTETTKTSNMITPTLAPKEQQFKRIIDDGQRLRKEANQNDKTDDSYLLSRILFSISLIIKCLYQQPITCKLSNDLIDILAAYKYHPDSGVRKAITNSLTIIRNCTPSVYFEEYLNDKTVRLFGHFLAQESELINRLRLSGNFSGSLNKNFNYLV